MAKKVGRRLNPAAYKEEHSQEEPAEMSPTRKVGLLRIQKRGILDSQVIA